MNKIKTGGLWAIAAALFLIASAFVKNETLYIVAVLYFMLAVIKAGFES